MTADHSPPSLAERARAAEPGLTRSLLGLRWPTPAAALRELADVAASLDEPGAWDRYGEHGPVAALERRVADLLDKPSAAMFPSGVMAQQSMLRVWCDARGSRRVAIPALVAPGQARARRPAVAARVRVRPAHRRPHRAAGRAPRRDPRTPRCSPARAAAARRGPPPSLLGRARGLLARLPRAQRPAPPRRGEDLGVGAVPGPQPRARSPGSRTACTSRSTRGSAGCPGRVVAGPEEEVAQARVWRSRMGGTLFSLMPFAVAALRGLDRELPRMAEYHEHAVLLAPAAGGARHPGDSAAPAHQRVPHPPRAPVADLDERRVVAMERERVRLSPPWNAADVPGWSVDRARRGAGHDGVGGRRGRRHAGSLVPGLASRQEQRPGTEAGPGLRGADRRPPRGARPVSEHRTHHAGCPVVIVRGDQPRR